MKIQSQLQSLWQLHLCIAVIVMVFGIVFYDDLGFDNLKKFQNVGIFQKVLL